MYASAQAQKATDFILNVKNVERELESIEKYSEEHNVSVMKETEKGKTQELEEIRKRKETGLYKGRG